MNQIAIGKASELSLSQILAECHNEVSAIENLVSDIGMRAAGVGLPVNPPSANAASATPPSCADGANVLRIRLSSIGTYLRQLNEKL